MTKEKNKLSRRQVLKTGAGAAAVAASPLGAPLIWAQEIKDIELRHVGGVLFGC